MAGTTFGDFVSYKLKAIIVWIMHLVTWPFTIPSLIGYRVFGSEEIFGFSAKLLSLIPGKLGQYIRTSFYCQTLKECKYDLLVGFSSFFAHPTTKVGRRVGLGSFTVVGTADIGNNVLVGSKVSILSGKYQHQIGYSSDCDKEIRYEEVKIGDNTWLGEGSIIMADIAGDCVVSAGSVVTKPMPSSMIAIGNPARFLKRENSGE